VPARIGRLHPPEPGPRAEAGQGDEERAIDLRLLSETEHRDRETPGTGIAVLLVPSANLRLVHRWLGAKKVDHSYSKRSHAN
jgi:hypothetical protein